MIPMKEILRELTGLSGVSGHEGKVADFLLQKLCGYTDDIHVDRIGNISVHLPSGRPGAAKVVVFGHMDEIGMIVKQIDGGGFLRFERIGGVHRQILPGTPVIVETESGKGIEGVIGVKSHHIIPQEEKNRVPDIEDLYIDIGSKSREDTLGRGVQAGNLITFKANWQDYGNGIVSCKSLDDRAADVILLSLIDLFHGGGDHPDLYIVFSVTEEFNIRGILPVIRRIQPDICIGVDITPAYDTPDLAGKGTVRLGGGPAVTYLNFHGRGTLAGHIYNEKLNAHFCRTAEECGISIQREVCIGVVTETGYICFEGTEGIITGSVSIPMRYTHTPIEMVSLDDLEDIVTLLYNSVKEITSAEDFKPNNFTGNWERGESRSS